MASEWLFPTETESEENVDKNRQEELFVFGYACKLFRDDDQARMIDAGKYMIPWMGDDRLKIDRYDGRGHLYDLTPYDADNYAKGKPVPIVTEEEAHIEQLCEDERYLELRTDLAQQSMYEEEEWKRYYMSLSTDGYKEVGFSYDSFGQQYDTEAAGELLEDPEEQPYEPAVELQVPPGLDIPATIKENAIIEKTAKFIAEHGAQMEIMMKTKQSNNPQFLFMHFENILHPYYKHMVKMIKAKKYKPKSPVKQEEEDHNESGEMDDDHITLHPALMTTNRASPTPEVYKPVPMPKVSIHETSYGALLKSMAKVNKEVEEKNKAKEIKREVKMEVEESTSLPDQSVYNTSSHSTPPPPGIEPVTLPKSEDTESDVVRVKTEPQENRTTSPPAQIVPPPPDAQPVVDRMAMYVAKNGEEFEIVVKSKKDPRFQFLEPWHMHFSYYSFKKHLFIQEMEREKIEKETEDRQKEKEKAEKLAKGVKFSLKKNKETESSNEISKKKVFEYDESSDEDKNNKESKERRSKSDISGTSTPVTDSDNVHNNKGEENLEKKMADQRVKDRLAASAREKLSLADKDKQIKLERKKKAAMFLNMLKSKTKSTEDIVEDKTADKQPTPINSGRNTPVKIDESKSRSHKSKHKSRDRSRSRDRKSRDKRSRSRDKRSRSRSSSRSKKKKRRKRSATPPSAYAVVKRSPIRRPPPPPSPRYTDMRTRYSRSPSGHSSRHRSRSPASRSKSKKKKRSKSPRSRRDESSHKKSSKSKKKKKSRSESRSPRKSSSHHLSSNSVIPEEEDDPPFKREQEVDPRVVSPAGIEGSTKGENSELEEGETRDTTPEPGQTLDTDTDNNPSKGPTPPPDLHSDRSRSGSPLFTPRSGSHSRSTTPSSASRSRSRSSSPATSKLPFSKSKSRSRSPYLPKSIGTSRGTTPSKSIPVSREVTPTPEINGGGDNKSGTLDPVQDGQPQTNVSSYMLNRVRAMIQASKEVTKKEDMFDTS